jgi:hypothetical protein
MIGTDRVRVLLKERWAINKSIGSMMEWVYSKQPWERTADRRSLTMGDGIKSDYD